MGTVDLLLGHKSSPTAPLFSVGTILAVRFSICGLPTTPAFTNALLIGMHVVSPTVNPRPSTNTQLDWMMFHKYWLPPASASAPEGAFVNNDVLIKSRRKITDPGQTLMLALEDHGAAATAWNVNISARILFAPA